MPSPVHNTRQAAMAKAGDLESLELGFPGVVGSHQSEEHNQTPPSSQASASFGAGGNGLGQSPLLSQGKGDPPVVCISSVIPPPPQSTVAGWTGGLPTPGLYTPHVTPRYRLGTGNPSHATGAIAKRPVVMGPGTQFPPPVVIHTLPVISTSSGPPSVIPAVGGIASTAGQGGSRSGNLSVAPPGSAPSSTVMAAPTYTTTPASAPSTATSSGDGSVQNLMDCFASALIRYQPSSEFKLSRFSGESENQSESALEDWLEDADRFMADRQVRDSDRAKTLIRYLTGAAKDELKCYSPAVRDSYLEVKQILREKFASGKTLSDLEREFHNRSQKSGESATEYSRALIGMYDRLVEDAPTDTSRQSFVHLRESTLKGRFRSGISSPKMEVEMRRLELNPTITFQQMRDHVDQLFRFADVTSPEAKKHPRVRVVDTPSSGESSATSKPLTETLAGLHQQQQQVLEMLAVQQQTNVQVQAQLNALRDNRQIPPAPSYPSAEGSLGSMPPREGSGPGSGPHSHQTPASDICRYCLRSGHWKFECPRLGRQPGGTPRGPPASKSNAPSPSGNGPARR
jgi:hypothetical protein